MGEGHEVAVLWCHARRERLTPTASGQRGKKCHGFLTVLWGSWRYFFKIPLVFVQYDIIQNVIDDIYDTN